MAELLQGAQGSQRCAASLQQLDALSRQGSVLYPEGETICRPYAEQGATLVSHNQREFGRVAGALLVDWAAA